MTVGGRKWVSEGHLFHWSGKEVFSYQHANDGDEGDDLGEPPKGKEETTQHFGDGISVKLCANANWRLSVIRLQSLGFGCSALCQCDGGNVLDEGGYVVPKLASAEGGGSEWMIISGFAATESRL